MPENLTTFAPNRLPLTGYLDVETHEVCKHNAQALYLGATGDTLAADETISAGHKHEDAATRLTWRQIATFPLHNDGASSVGTAPDECYDAVIIDNAVNVNMATCRLWLTAAELVDVIPRVRVSNDNSATTNCTVTFDFYLTTDFTAAVLSYALVFSTATLRNRVWVDGVTQDLTGLLDPDPDVATRYPVVCFVRGALAADVEDVAVHEVSFGVTP